MKLLSKLIALGLMTFWLTNTGRSLDVVLRAEMPFYLDGTGIISYIGVRESADNLFGLNAPFYLGGGAVFQYARGAEGDHTVDLIDFGAALTGEYVFRFDKVGLGLGVDILLSYSSAFGGDNFVSSVGASLRPSISVAYQVADKLELEIELGYNTGLYSFYLGYVFFGVGANLGL